MSDGERPDIEKAARDAGPIGVASISAAETGVLALRCSPQPTIQTGRWRLLRASSRLATSTAAPPVVGITISSMRSGSAIIRLSTTSSMSIATSWKTADGLRLALRRCATGIRAIARAS